MSGLCQNGNYVPELFQDTGKCLKEANRLPSQQDFKYFLTFPEFDSAIVNEQQKVLSLLSQLSRFVNSPLTNFTEISKCAKLCLETVKSNLETLKCPQGLQESLVYSLSKPQLSFTDIPDNSYGPHIPKLLTKLHGKTDVPAGILKAQQLKMIDCRPEIIEHYEEITHPYGYELETLEYTSEQYVPKASSYKQTEAVPLEIVDSKSSFDQMIFELKSCRDLAVDLENHQMRSYQGICCLIQISSRDKDYIIDPLAIRDLVPGLAEILANPRIVKVFHGSDNDLEWLQRDFSLYVVNLFDTAQAARELKYASFGLNFLLKSFCDIDSDKRYQLADWRLRPLPTDMIKYARCDTHFLLYIYDRLREELIHKSLALNEDPNTCINKVLFCSKQLCLKLYTKTALSKDPNNTEYYRLCKARDLVARLEDENPEFIMPHTLILAIASEKPSSLEQMMVLGESEYFEKYGKYFFSVIRKEKAKKSQFSNDFFRDADWKENQRLPFSEVFDSMKKADYSFEDVLADVSEILNLTQNGGNETGDDGKGGKSLDWLLEKSEVNENLIPKNLNEIFELSNNSRKKNKNKAKTVNEVMSPEKTVSINLQKAFREIGWE